MVGALPDFNTWDVSRCKRSECDKSVISARLRVWSVRDGMILWQIRGTHGDTGLDRTGLGHYTADTSSFSYEYTSALEVDQVNDGPTIVHDSLPFTGIRAFSTHGQRRGSSILDERWTAGEHGLW